MERNFNCLLNKKDAEILISTIEQTIEEEEANIDIDRDRLVSLNWFLNSLVMFKEALDET
jgi:hypothetical protein